MKAGIATPVVGAPAEVDHRSASAETDVAVSVVIPTLNEEKLISSLLAAFSDDIRSRLGIELIVSDGGSTDLTIKLASGADKIVQAAEAVQQTIAEGRNLGAQAASGAVLLFFNADVGLPEDIEGFLRSLIESASTRGAATCRVLVDPEVARISDRVVLGTCNVLFWFINQIGIGMGRGECHAVRRDLFEQVDGYREDLAAGEDFDLFNRLAKHMRKSGSGKIHFLWNWTIHEDPRRYRRQGYARIMSMWFLNFLSVLVRRKALSTTWDPIR